MYIAVIEDNKTERDELVRLLSIVCPDAGMEAEIKSYEDGEQFLKDSASISFSVIFVDIYMEPIDGIMVSRQFRDSNIQPYIIFTTSNSEHYADAFSVHAFDYILKPVTEEKLRSIFDDIRKSMSDSSEPVFMIPPKDYPVLHKDIRYIYSDANYLIMVTDTSVRFRMTFSELKKRLHSDSRFLVINRGVIVNMEHIKTVRGTTCIMDDNTIFPLNSRTHSELRETYTRWQFDQRAGLISRKGSET